MLFIYILANNDRAILYQTSYLFFSIFNDIATIGLIPGTTKITSSLDESEYAKFLGFGRRLTRIIGILAIIIYFLLGIFYLRYNKNSNPLGLIIAGSSLFITPSLYFYRGYNQGLLNMNKVAFSLILEGIVRVCVISLIFFINVNISYLALLANFLAFVCSYLYIKTSIDHKNNQSEKYLVKYFNYCLPYGMTTLFFTLYQAIDVFMIYKYVKDIEYVSAYLYEANRLIYLPVMIASSFAATLISSFKEKQDLKSIFLYLNAILVFFTGLYLLYSKEIFAFLYPKNAVGYIVLRYMVIQIIIFGLYKIILGILHAINKVNGIVCLTWISLILKYTLNKILIVGHSYMGAIIATNICALLCICYALIILRFEKIKIFSIYMYEIFKYILIFIVSLSVLMLEIKIFKYILAKNILLQILLLLMNYVIIIIIIILWKNKQSSDIIWVGGVLKWFYLLDLVLLAKQRLEKN